METIEPEFTGELLERDDDAGAPQVAPPVVAVVVTRDPGPWLEQTLAALAAQDYSSLSVLVLDNGSTDDLTPRIATSMPRAFVRRASADANGRGFAEAANEALEAVEGATFLFFCHDDVTLDEDAVRIMVEEAYRSNAGIVGPKLVDDAHPEILLEVGMSVDHYGVPYSGIEPEEVDQEQHDAVRDVFFVSNAAMLVRTDLFHELSGFDPATVPGADDVDLCWRARLAGARVVVAPSARARHREAAPNEPRTPKAPDATDACAETRSRVRMLFKSYSTPALLWVLPIAFLLGMIEALGLVFTGHGRRAWAVVRGWFSAFAHPGELRRARHETQALRRVDDGDVRDLMIRGSARIRNVIAHRAHAGERIHEMSAQTRRRVERASHEMRRAPAIIGVILAAVVLFATRSLLFSSVPEVGSFLTWPGAGDAWATLTGSWRTTFLGSPTSSTPAFGAIAFLDAVLLGHAGLARSLVVGGALSIGTFGAYRLVRPLAQSAMPGVAAAIAYAANPVVRNAIWKGELGPLLCYALAPFALAVFFRVVVASNGDRTLRAHRTITIALLTATVAAVWPPAFFLAAFIACAFGLATFFTRERAGSGEVAVLALAASGLALLLCTPWVCSLIGADAATLGLQTRPPLDLLDVLRFHTGRAGAGWAPWGILAAAIVPLAIATGDRLVWATRAWMLALGSFALTWLPSRLAPDAAVPAPEGLLVGAALGLAVAAGLGVAAVHDDLRNFHFGWRQVMTVVAIAGISVASLGLVADSFSGRFGLEAEDWASKYAWMTTNPGPGEFRVLWLGDESVLPGDSKPAGTGGFTLTRNGPGDARAQWAAPEGTADRVVVRAIEAAEAGATSRLGHLLAPAGVRYITFITRSEPDGGAHGAPQPALENALAHQLDLTLSRVETNGVVYENDAFVPMHAIVAPGTETMRIDEADPLQSALRSERRLDTVGVTYTDGETEPIGPGTLLWSEAADSGWHASSDGDTAARRDAFGWTNAFALESKANVSVQYDGSLLGRLLRSFQVVLWVGVAVAWFVTRRRARVPLSTPA
jgi:GT2 family glycosyltransferase